MGTNISFDITFVFYHCLQFENACFFKQKSNAEFIFLLTNL